MALTATQKRNCAKLAAYLEALPEGYEHFSMSTFCGLDNVMPAKEYDLCGTAACAIGHGPAAGVKVLLREIDGWGDIDWWAYSERFSPGYSPTWRFMFSGMWDETDNTPQGAAQRIRWILAGKEPLSVGDLSYRDKVDA